MMLDYNKTEVKVGDRMWYVKPRGKGSNYKTFEWTIIEQDGQVLGKCTKGDIYPVDELLPYSSLLK